MHNTYKLTIIYFIFFSFLLLTSALMLFATKIGFSIEAINNYYLGNELAFTQAKSISGLLKVIYPHFLSIGLLMMVLLHFVYFTSFQTNKYFIKFIIFSYIIVFLEIVSGFGLLLGGSFFAIIKLSSFILIFFIFLYIFWIILHSILTQTNLKV